MVSRSPASIRSSFRILVDLVWATVSVIVAWLGLMGSAARIASSGGICYFTALRVSFWGSKWITGDN